MTLSTSVASRTVGNDREGTAIRYCHEDKNYLNSTNLHSEKVKAVYQIRINSAIGTTPASVKCQTFS